MSDLLNAYDVSKFKEEISLSTNHCLNYVKKECIAGDRIRFTGNIPNEHLKSWCERKEDGGLYSQFSYVEILSASIVENGVKIRQDCIRLNGLIRRSCGEVKDKYRQLQGRTRVQYLQRLRKIAIRQKELINVRLIEEQIKKIRGNAKQLLHYVSKLMRNFHLRENEIVRISYMFCLSPLNYSFYVVKLPPFQLLTRRVVPLRQHNSWLPCKFLCYYEETRITLRGLKCPRFLTMTHIYFI